jgi:hypothetical protein
MLALDQYFADAEFESTDFAAEAFAFADAWITFCTDTGYAARWTQNVFLYNGADQEQSEDGQYNASSFQIVGDNGELLLVTYNDFRNLLQHILNMTVSQPPNMTAQAINDDAESLIAAQTFDGVFGYYMQTYRQGRLLRESRITVENALVTDTGYTLIEWDPYAGKPTGEQLDPETGEPVVDDRGQPQMTFEGDMYFKARSCWDVFFDPGCEDDDESDWVLVRDQVNKYEYANRYPHYKTEILGSSAIQTDTLTQWRRGFRKATKTNMINVYKFYHRPTAMMPKGRYAILLDAKTVLLDGPNPYDQLPVFSIRAMEGLGSIVGYAPANVIAPVQQSQNILSSAMMTNFSMFGVQNIAVKDSDQFDVTELAGAMNIIKYSDVAPQALQLAKQADGIGDFYAVLGRKGETLSGINSVVRGDPESSLKSGKALGIVQASAVQFQSALAASYAQYLKNIGNFMLFVFRKYVKEERITQIVGENEMAQSATWSGDTFGPIDRVTAEIIDPAMRTLGYRTDLAMFMAQNNLTRTPQEFLTVLTTGQLKPMYRAEITELNTIHQENSEMLKAAKTLEAKSKELEAQVQAGALDPMLMNQMLDELAQQLAPPVIRWDNDDLHMGEHTSVACAPAVRRNGLVTRIVMAHMTMHEQNKVIKAQQAAVEAAKAQLAAQTAVQQLMGPMMPQPGMAPEQGAPQEQPQEAQQQPQMQAPMPQPGNPQALA